jgi:hypothetical protein
VPRREGGAAQVGQLFGMQLDRQARRAPRRRAGDLVIGRKGDALAEGVDGIDQTFGMGGAQRGDATSAI